MRRCESRGPVRVTSVGLMISDFSATLGGAALAGSAANVFGSPNSRTTIALAQRRVWHVTAGSLGFRQGQGRLVEVTKETAGRWGMQPARLAERCYGDRVPRNCQAKARPVAK